MIYFFVFLISSLWTSLSSFFFKKQFYPLAVICGLATVISISTLAGWRSLLVGTDTQVYARLFDLSVHSANISIAFQNLANANGLESGYVLLNFLISRFTQDYHCFQFICALIISSNVFIAIVLNRKRMSMTLGWLTYCCLLFSNSLNIVRQTIALSIFLVSIMLLLNNHCVWSIGLILMAVLFHTTAVFGIIIWVLGWTFLHTTNQKTIVIVLIITMTAMLLMPFLLSQLGNAGIFTGKYNTYLNSNADVSIINGLLTRLPMIGLILMEFFSQNYHVNEKIDWLYIPVFIEALLLPLQAMNPVIGRLVLYFSMIKIVAYPTAIQRWPFRYSKWLLIGCYLIMICLIFYIQIMVSHDGEIYPFIVD